MRVPAKRLAWIGGGLVLAGVIGIGLLLPAPEEGAVGPGSPLPDFRAMTVDPPVKTRTLLDYRGDVLLVNVWATWCPPCVEEMPTMQRLHESFADRGLRVVAISVDDAGSAGLIRQFRADHGLTFEILHDVDGTVFDTFRLNGVPQTFLVDRSGIIRLSRYAADWNSPENRDAVAGLLED